MKTAKPIVLLLVAVIAGAAFATGITAVVTGAASGTNTTIYGCVSKAGRLSNVGTTAPTCASTATPLSWNSQGTPGAAGAPGAQGPVGQASVVGLAPAALCPQPPAPPPSAGTGAFLAIPSIAGESTDQAHPNQIDVLSWSWGVGNAGKASGCQTNNGNPAPLDFTVVKHFDKASAPLMLDTAKETHLSTITLSIPKLGTDYIQLSLDNAVATSVQYLGTPGGDQIAREQVTFTGTKATLTYRQPLPGGNFAGPLSTCFDFSLQGSC
jgi:type VI secretion system secreted protein Hcp